MGYREARAAWERDYWGRVFTACNGRVTHAARRSGVSRQGLYKLMQRFQIERPHKAGRLGNDAWHSLEDSCPSTKTSQKPKP
jgi:DNA-binding NtrC family response regulator